MLLERNGEADRKKKKKKKRIKVESRCVPWIHSSSSSLDLDSPLFRDFSLVIGCSVSRCACAPSAVINKSATTQQTRETRSGRCLGVRIIVKKFLPRGERYATTTSFFSLLRSNLLAEGVQRRDSTRRASRSNADFRHCSSSSVGFATRFHSLT